MGGAYDAASGMATEARREGLAPAPLGHHPVSRIELRRFARPDQGG